jgi:hypothetical protein
VTSSVYAVDTHPPTFTPAVATFTTNAVQVAWGTPGDALSGVAANGVQVSYTINGGPSTILLTGASPTQTSAQVPFSDSLYGASVAFAVQVTDNAGNAATSTASVTLPPKLLMTATVDPVSDSQNMQVDVQFNLSPQVLKAAFSNVQVTRTLLATAGTTVTLPSLALNTGTIAVDGSGVFTASGGWSVNGQGNAVYADVIPVSSAAGHKTWQYAALPSPWIGNLPSPVSVVLPNHQGTVAMTVLDVNGNAYDPSNPTQFQLGSDRKVHIVFQGADPDQDHWSYELDRVTQVTSLGLSLTNYARVSGNGETDYPYNAGYPAQSNLVTLNVGVNNLEALWTEGDPNSVFHSAATSISVTQTAPGTYQIQVSTVSGDTLPSDGSSALTRPGEPLSFSLAGSGTLTYAWDFGDGTTAGNVAQVQHTYGQAPGQTSDTATYTLNITVSDGTTTQTVPLGITVRDTQEGVLYTSETWHGDHTVTGLVEVPQGLSLSIAPNVGTPSSVTMSGGLGAGYAQGLLIDAGASLTVADGVAFAADSSHGWGSIDIFGTAAIGADDLQGATKAIAVGPGGSTALTGTNLHGNQYGLQVVGGGGGTTVTVTGATIANNTRYGIKEDAGARPSLTGTSITNNFRNYYSFDQGLLTIDQINALNAQAATPNTGDTNEGTDQ